MLVAIRGAVQVAADTPQAIATAVHALIDGLSAANGLRPDRILSAIFSMTPDLSAAFPAAAARGRGWAEVAMLCMQEIAVPGALERVCRVLVHADCDGPPQHVYLGATRVLRPDRAPPEPE